jgi:hypothetical protein
MPAMTANKFERYCESLRDVLWDDGGCLASLQRACTILDDVLGGSYERDKAKDSAIQTQAQAIIEGTQGA